MSRVSRASSAVTPSPSRRLVVSLTIPVALALSIAAPAGAQSGQPVQQPVQGIATDQDASADRAPTSVLVPETTLGTQVVEPTVPPPTTPTPQSPETLSSTDAFNEFRRHFDTGQYAAAVPYAQRVLDLTTKDASAPDAEEVQVAWMNLATAQSLAGDHTAAETSFQRVIELVEGSGRPLHARLARAYAGLASAYHDGDRHELAVKNFEQAVGLTRRHEGLLSEQQVPLLEKYIDSLTELGRYGDALRGQRYILRVATRKHGAYSMELAPTLEDIGRWYARVGAYDHARRVLKRSIELIEAAEGPDSPRLLSPLSTLAACDRKQLLDPGQQSLVEQDPDRAAMFAEAGVVAPAYSPATLANEAEKSLLRAVAIAERRTDPSPLQIADTRTQLGDWYQGRGQPDRALPNYQAAWVAAVRATDQRVHGKLLHEALFGEPVLLQVVRPEGWNKYSERPPDQVEIRNVQVEFTVSARGKIEVAKVLDDAGDPKRGAKTIDALEDTARYRPRIAAGEPVATTGVTFSQPWIVLLPQAPDVGPGAKDAAASGKERATPASAGRAADDAAPAAGPAAKPGTTS